MKIGINYNSSDVGRKKLVNIGRLTKKLSAPVLTHQKSTVAFAMWRCCERNFNPLNCLSLTCGTRKPQVGLCCIFLVTYETLFKVIPRYVAPDFHA